MRCQPSFEILKPDFQSAAAKLKFGLKPPRLKLKPVSMGLSFALQTFHKCNRFW
jgi:hypothetical protein